MSIQPESNEERLKVIEVLMIEDNSGDARLVQETLVEVENTQFNLQWAKSLSEGIDLILKNQFDIILLDLSLPDSHGLETIDKVHEYTNTIPIIVFTGQRDDELGIETIQKGAQDYLVKGYADRDLLYRSIKYSIERKNAEQERESLQEQLEQSRKMESIGRLAGGIAHDFNNILGAISGYADMILRKFAKDNEKMTKYANTIITASQRAADLTANLLAFARKGKFEVTYVDMHEIINDINVLLSHTIEKNIRITLNLNAAETTVKGDSGNLQNAILNLIVNARDAMPNGGDLTISTETVNLAMNELGGAIKIKPGTIFKLSVKDTGIGIDGEIKTKIFDPFFTTKEMGKGTGLGLSSAYGCIVNHGGDITVESKKGHGSTFVIYLPIVETVTAKPEIKQPESNIIEGKGTILIVDDEEMIRDSVFEMLVELGYEVVCCSSGEEAIKYYSENFKKIDVVILDLIMPFMNGLACFTKLKEIKFDVAVIISSGYSEEDKEKQAVEEGAKAFLKKPYQISELSSTVAKVLKYK